MLIVSHDAMRRSSHRRCSLKKGVLRNFAKFTGKHLCLSLACNFIKKEALAQVLSCEFCKISKNTFSTEQLQTAASECERKSIFDSPLKGVLPEINA